MRPENGSYRPLRVTHVEHVPSDRSDIGILHFEDPATNRTGTLISEPTATTVCYSGQPPKHYPTAIISMRTREQLPAPQRV
jgi:hypothetical protein